MKTLGILCIAIALSACASQRAAIQIDPDVVTFRLAAKQNPECRVTFTKAPDGSTPFHIENCVTG